MLWAVFLGVGGVLGFFNDWDSFWGEKENPNEELIEMVKQRKAKFDSAYKGIETEFNEIINDTSIKENQKKEAISYLIKIQNDKIEIDTLSKKYQTALNEKKQIIAHETQYEISSLRIQSQKQIQENPLMLSGEVNTTTKRKVKDLIEKIEGLSQINLITKSIDIEESINRCLPKNVKISFLKSPNDLSQEDAKRLDSLINVCLPLITDNDYFEFEKSKAIDRFKILKLLDVLDSELLNCPLDKSYAYILFFTKVLLVGKLNSDDNKSNYHHNFYQINAEHFNDKMYNNLLVFKARGI